MREYSPTISLTKNSRGIYSLDTVMGCASGMANEPGGCYGDCYAANASKRYGYDFSRSVLRHFESEAHRRSIVRRINRIPLDFVRMGSSGDPSEDWTHTVSILRGIDKCNKQIVIITRHWSALTDEQLAYFGINQRGRQHIGERIGQARRSRELLGPIPKTEALLQVHPAGRVVQLQFG